MMVIIIVNIILLVCFFCPWPPGLALIVLAIVSIQKKIQNVSSYHYFFKMKAYVKILLVVEVVESSSAGAAKYIYV